MMKDMSSVPIDSEHLPNWKPSFRWLLSMRRAVKALSDQDLTQMYHNAELAPIMQQMVQSEWDKRDWLWRS